MKHLKLINKKVIQVTEQDLSSKPKFSGKIFFIVDGYVYEDEVRAVLDVGGVLYYPTTVVARTMMGKMEQRTFIAEKDVYASEIESNKQLNECEGEVLLSIPRGDGGVDKRRLY